MKQARTTWETGAWPNVERGFDPLNNQPSFKVTGVGDSKQLR